MTDKSPVVSMAEDVQRFLTTIIGLPIPEEPTRLTSPRKVYAVGHLTEELEEFARSHKIEDEVDALIDLVYVALGRLIEMGVCPGAAFEEVHQANMQKQRGQVSKRPNSLGYDAVKPDGWTGPDIEKMLRITKSDVEYIAMMQEVAELYTGEEEDEDEQA